VAVDVQQIVEPVISCEQCGTCSSACPVTGIEGFNIRRIEHAVQLKRFEQVANTGVQWVCTMCGRCEAVCPNGYKIMTTTRGLRAMTPADLVPAAAPCQEACPAHINIPQYVRLIAEDKPEEAYAVIREKVPLPAVLGRTCAHPCEAACKRAPVSKAISICALKRYASDNTPAEAKAGFVGKAGADTGRKVAVIGSGPGGLTAAFYLRKKGHQVTVFEAKDKAGGMLRYGIPYSRLPEDVLDQEISDILGLGVELKTGVEFGKDVTFASLTADGYEAVFVAVGMQDSRKIPLEGSDSADVLWGVEFLNDVADKKPVDVKKNVVVIGGGNVAIDVAMTAQRCGAENVTMACLESREEMPAFEWEIEEAVEEGVELLPSWGPSRIVLDGDAVKQVELVQCTSVFDDTGAFCPMFGQEKKVVEADQVILAIGQASDLGFMGGEGVANGLIECDGATQATPREGVWAGGDAVVKPAGVPGTIIEAIAAGRRAAESIDAALGGDGVIDEVLWTGEGPSDYTGERLDGFADLERRSENHIPVEQRKGNFNEVSQGLAKEDAIEEAKRCFHCDLEIKLAMSFNGGGPA
jgi:NADPH-dependent glutamate synthase beta subunit-like oxidoreductase